MYSGCLVVRVGGSRLGVGLIKCCDFQRSLLARSISDPSVLATRGAYVFIFSLCCLLSLCNVFTTPRVGPQSRPLPLVINIHLNINCKFYLPKYGMYEVFRLHCWLLLCFEKKFLSHIVIDKFKEKMGSLMKRKFKYSI